MTIVVPPALTANHVKQDGEAGRAWSAGLPAPVNRWDDVVATGDVRRAALRPRDSSAS